jgi:hypothetical protein
MNERIIELAEQCRIETYGVNGELLEFGFDQEKFAELIVRECAEICLEMSAKCAGLEGDGALAKDCAYWIKKDFGVEE